MRLSLLQSRTRTRLGLLRLLNEQSGANAICVSALAMLIGVSQPAVSQHLSVLKAAGLVEGEKRSNYMHYYVKSGALDRCQEALKAAFQYEIRASELELCHGKRCPKQANGIRTANLRI